MPPAPERGTNDAVQVVGRSITPDGDRSNVGVFLRRTRIRLLPRNPHWTETQRDAIRSLEYSIGLRGMHRPGDIVEVPLTNGHIQRMLKKVGARRSGNHYARACLAELVAMNVIEDTGRVVYPLKQPSNQNLRWFRVFRVIPIFRSIQSLTPTAYGYQTRPLWLTGSLLSFLRCQGKVWKKREGFTPQKRSAQAAFHALGPP